MNTSQRMGEVQGTLQAGSTNSGQTAIGDLTDVLTARARLATLNRAFTFGGDSCTKFLVAVDGSEGADAALAVTLNELMRSRDSLHVLHAFDSTKSREDFADSMKPGQLRESIDTRLMAQLPQKTLPAHVDR